MHSPEHLRWSHSHLRIVNAPAATVWQLFADPESWPSWNPGVTRVALEGEFKEGTWFKMYLPDGTVIRSVLDSVESGCAFADRTQFAGVVITVSHRVDSTGDVRCKVSYSINVVGPDAGEVGSAVCADFPEVLEGLARAAESIARSASASVRVTA